MTKVPAFYFPNKVFLVDDNKDFLTNFSLQLNPRLAYSIFESPHEALRYLLQDNKVSQLNQQIFSSYQEGNDCPITNQMVKLDISAIHKEIFDQQRFDEVSVVIVDYDMPGLNGLDFCKRLKNHPVKKILLTGKADEKLAIQAFNEGLIDLFIQKNDSDIVNQINTSITQLQQQYFLDATAVILKMLAVENVKFLQDPAFIEFFTKLIERNEVVEYYLTEITGSFLMLDEDASPSWLVMKYYEDLKLHYEIAKDSDAPAEVIESLRSGEKIPYSWQSKDYYQVAGDEWYDQLHIAEELNGSDTYYYAYITNLKSFDIKPGEILSYRDYLARIDVGLM